MKKIEKKVTIELTEEEVNSPNPINIVLKIKLKNGEDIVTYNIEYPKETNEAS